MRVFVGDDLFDVELFVSRAFIQGSSGSRGSGLTRNA